MIGHVMHLSLAAALSRPTCPNCGSVYVPVEGVDGVVARCPNDADNDCHYAPERSLIAAIRSNPTEWPKVVDALFSQNTGMSGDTRTKLLAWGEHFVRDVAHEDHVS